MYIIYRPILHCLPEVSPHVIGQCSQETWWGQFVYNLHLRGLAAGCVEAVVTSQLMLQWLLAGWHWRSWLWCIAQCWTVLEHTTWLILYRTSCALDVGHKT
jgi:hypothetical protein